METQSSSRSTAVVPGRRAANERSIDQLMPMPMMAQPNIIRAPTRTQQQAHRRYMARSHSSSTNASTNPPFLRRLAEHFRRGSTGLIGTNQPSVSIVNHDDPLVSGEFDQDMARAVVAVSARLLGMDPAALSNSPGLLRLVARNMQWFHHTPDVVKLTGLVVAKKLNQLMTSSNTRELETIANIPEPVPITTQDTPDQEWVNICPDSSSSSSSTPPAPDVVDTSVVDPVANGETAPVAPLPTETETIDTEPAPKKRRIQSRRKPPTPLKVPSASEAIMMDLEDSDIVKE